MNEHAPVPSDNEKREKMDFQRLTFQELVKANSEISGLAAKTFTRRTDGFQSATGNVILFNKDSNGKCKIIECTPELQKSIFYTSAKLMTGNFPDEKSIMNAAENVIKEHGGRIIE